MSISSFLKKIGVTGVFSGKLSENKRSDFVKMREVLGSENKGADSMV